MCGIAGVLGAAGDAAALHDLATAMADELAHRGPDDAGTWVDTSAGLAFGHRRLSIVDLSPSGHQPMASSSGRLVLSYNGEVYNHRELRRRLEGEGVRFRGTSDTEVLVESLERWGVPTTLDRVNGMYALALWDSSRRELTLARDRFGEKPLYYGAAGGVLAFASELRSLRHVDGITGSLDRDAVALFLRYKYVPAPWSIWQGVRKLPPGSVLTVPAGRTDDLPEPVQWWDPLTVAREGAADRRAGSHEALLDELDALLLDAVDLRLQADVPVGAFLSGGIDSSLVVALAARASPHAVRTFTIANADDDLDESDEARAVAAHLGTDHTELEVTAEDALSLVPEMAAMYGEPFADSSQIPTYLVSRLARAEVTVALSGDGGDEIFGGYNRYTWLPALWRRAGRIPTPVRRVAAGGLGRVTDPTWDRLGRALPAARRPRMLGLKVAKAASVLGLPDPEAAFGRLVSHWDRPTDVVLGASEPQLLTHRPDLWPAGIGLVEQMMAVDAATYLPDDVLVKVDRATMAVSLEARVPLLDHRVAELAARLPLDLKVDGATTKVALRRLLARHLPTELFERPKSGFGVPIAAWLRGPLRDWAGDLLAPDRLRRQGLLVPEPVTAAWDAHLAGRRDASYELWDVLMLQQWLESAIPASKG